MEHARWEEDRRKDKLAKEEIVERRNQIQLEKLRQDKVDAMHRATIKRDQARRIALRDRKIEEIEEKRMRKFREQQYIEQAKAAQTKFGELPEEAGDDEDMALTESMMDTRTKAEKKEQQEFQRTFEQQQRAQRRQERAERVKKRRGEAGTA